MVNEIINELENQIQLKYKTIKKLKKMINNQQ